MHRPPPSAPPSGGRGPALTQGLKGRQITMISIGGVIGAGLFVGSSTAVAAAGPAVLVSFLLAAALVVLVMQMLGEMAVAHPDTGSFSTYADRALGRWAGFSVGWLYWWFYVLVIPIEAIAAGGTVDQARLLALPLDTSPRADRPLAGSIFFAGLRGLHGDSRSGSPFSRSSPRSWRSSSSVCSRFSGCCRAATPAESATSGVTAGSRRGAGRPSSPGCSRRCSVSRAARSSP
ncbi:hypothetical protein STENM223S_06971 [Streptomyces tendae]